MSSFSIDQFDNDESFYVIFYTNFYILTNYRFSFSFQPQPPMPPPPNFSRGPMLDDYSRNNGPPDFDSRGGGPPLKRSRTDAINDGHWASAPTDRRGGGGGNFQSQPPHWRPNPNNSQTVDESLDDTLTAAQHGVSPFFQTATDEEIRGLNRTLRVFQK